MPRYIDADALIISLAKDRSALVNNHVPHGELHRIDETIWKVVEAPAADVVPVVRGELARMDETQALLSVEWKCSQCGQEICIDGILTAIGAGWKYCPSCGARMDGEE